MKRWWHFGVLVLGLVSFWWILTPPKIAAPQPHAQISPVPAKEPQRIPAQAPVPLVLAPVEKALRKSPLKLDPHEAVIDSSRPPIIQNNRKYHFLEGLSAVPEGTPGDSQGSLSGYVIMNSGSVPDGVEAFALVKRDDNDIVGILTGTIRAIGERPTTNGRALTEECSQGHIQEAYPALKSFLLKANSSSDSAEFFQCLSNLNRFKKLEWEILDHPRGNR